MIDRRDLYGHPVIPRPEVGDPARGSLAQELNEARLRIEELETDLKRVGRSYGSALCELRELRDRKGDQFWLGAFTGMLSLAGMIVLVRWWGMA